jgi:hypothetical protein
MADKATEKAYLAVIETQDYSALTDTTGVTNYFVVIQNTRVPDHLAVINDTRVPGYVSMIDYMDTPEYATAKDDAGHNRTYHEAVEDTSESMHTDGVGYH